MFPINKFTFGTSPLSSRSTVIPDLLLEVHVYRSSENVLFGLYKQHLQGLDFPPASFRKAVYPSLPCMTPWETTVTGGGIVLGTGRIPLCKSTRGFWPYSPLPGPMHGHLKYTGWDLALLYISATAKVELGLQAFQSQLCVTLRSQHHITQIIHLHVHGASSAHRDLAPASWLASATLSLPVTAEPSSSSLGLHNSWILPIICVPALLLC